MRTARFNSVKYADDFKRMHGNYERFAYKQFKSALDEQVAPVIKHVKAYGSISYAVSDMLITKAPMQAAYREVYTRIGVRHAKATRDQINRLGKKGLLSFLSDKWNRLMEAFYLNESAERISDVTDTTREKVRKVLADSLDLPTSERASYIEKTLGSDEFNRNRALVIARTESTTAANKGAEIGNEDADYETAKQWISIMDQNTRPTHVDADGQVVMSDELFVVGSSECRYPGDTTLPAAECIQCRCTLAYIPILDELGLPKIKKTA